MKQETITLHIPGLTRTYTFYHTSDCHIHYARPDATDEDKAFAEVQTKRWSPKGILPVDAFDDALDTADAAQADGIFLCGDVANYYVADTIEYIRQRLARVSTEVMYVCGNHEGLYPGKNLNLRDSYPDYEDMMYHSPAGWARDFDEFIVVGIDNGDRKITQQQLDFLEEQIAKAKPILLLMHIPMITDSIIAPVKEEHGEDGPAYFLFGKPDDTELSQKFCEVVKRDGNHIAAVFAGHIHLSHAGEFAPGRMQYTSAPCFTGAIRKVILTGDQ